MKLRTMALLAAALAATFLLAGCEKLRARDSLNKGVQAFKGAKYADAVQYFKTAVELDPTFPTARLYLATAYRSQYIPGAGSEENNLNAKLAMEEFQKVLDQDPNNVLAIQSIASLHYDMAQGFPTREEKFKKLDEAKQWNERLIKVKPDSKEAFYTLGVIAWLKTYPVRGEARQKMGMKAEDPGPLKDKAPADKKMKAEIKERNLPMVEEGIGYLRKAIEVDKEYDDAYAYLNLLLRERADLADDSAGWKKDSDEADAMVEKALEIKKIKASRAPTQVGITSEGGETK